MAQHPLLPKAAREAVRSRPRLRRAIWALEAGLVGVLWALFWLLPTDVASRFGRRCLRVIGPRLAKNRYVFRNLETAFPECSPAQREALAREIWGGFGAMLAELPHLSEIASKFDRRVEVVVEGRVRALSEANLPAVFVTAHVGSWDLAPLATDAFGLPLTVIYSPNSNPYIDRFVRRFRSALGCGLLDREGSLRALMRELAAGRSIGIVTDQRVDDGEPVPYFGVPTPTTLVPARLALRYDCELVPVLVERLRDARFRIVVSEPVRPCDSAAPVRAQARQMTEDLNRRFEAWIRERPEQWMCLTRRWEKPNRLRSARAGRPAELPAPHRDAAELR